MCSADKSYLFTGGEPLNIRQPVQLSALFSDFSPQKLTFDRLFSLKKSTFKSNFGPPQIHVNY